MPHRRSFQPCSLHKHHLRIPFIVAVISGEKQFITGGCLKSRDFVIEKYQNSSSEACSPSSRLEKRKAVFPSVVACDTDGLTLTERGYLVLPNAACDMC